MKHLATARHPGEIWEMDDGKELDAVHFREDCATDVCVLHSPTKHHMRDFMLIWRDDRHIFERLCPHGAGHPDPDQVAYWNATLDEDDASAQGGHGCDGCCARPPSADTQFVKAALRNWAYEIDRQAGHASSESVQDQMYKRAERIRALVDRVTVGDAE